MRVASASDDNIKRLHANQESKSYKQAFYATPIIMIILFYDDSLRKLNGIWVVYI